MKFTPFKKILQYKFDFDIGYLIKSPCRECETIRQFPECIDDCDQLDKIHAVLAEAINCSRNK